jgi:chromatin remodeling complex protein RSC6
MVRTSKTPVATQNATPVEPKAEKAPKAPKAEKAAKAPKAPKVEAAAPAVAPAVSAEPTPVHDTTTTVVEASSIESSILQKINEFEAKLQQATCFISTLKNDYKTLSKSFSRELKNSQKSVQRKKKTSANRAPSGFTKPTKITDELAHFLGKEVGSELARTEVSKEINRYVKANDLKDKTNGRIIIADQNLSNLLRLSPGDQLTYFNLQRYLKHHFIKADASVAGVSA